MKLQSTIMKISIHLENDSPVFGESATHVSVDDESGGTFLVIEQHYDDSKVGTVRMCVEELEAVMKAARKLIGQPSCAT